MGGKKSVLDEVVISAVKMGARKMAEKILAREQVDCYELQDLIHSSVENIHDVGGVCIEGINISIDRDPHYQIEFTFKHFHMWHKGSFVLAKPSYPHGDKLFVPSVNVEDIEDPEEAERNE